jgi:predicted MFS family arabinose efflux permease
MSEAQEAAKETRRGGGAGDSSGNERGGGSGSRPDEEAAALPPARLRQVILVLAIGTGLVVANIYYAQPLLSPIGSTFGVSYGSATLVVTLTQFGYALGMLTLLPLGDMLENRALASRTLIGTAAALVAAGISPFFGMFLVMSVLVGVSSVVAQILVPLAAHVAPEKDRGRIVGTVMTGLLLGIMLARTVSSLVAAAWGWRTIYLISGALMIALSVLLRRVLPYRKPEHTTVYAELMRTTARLAREEPVLRRRALCQALMFGAFSCFWTSVEFELTSRHHFSHLGIAVFALIGAAGAGVAPLAGWVGDRGHGRAGSGVVIALAVVAMLLAGFGSGSVVLLGVAGILLDLAVQGHQSFSLRDIYGLRENARARVNTVYMTSIFVGGAMATALSGTVNDSYGWKGVCLLGAALALVALLVWVYSVLRPPRGRTGAATARGSATTAPEGAEGAEGADRATA